MKQQEEEIGEISKELLAKIEKAAKEGALQGAKEAGRAKGVRIPLRILLLLVLVMFGLGLAAPTIYKMTKAKTALEQEADVEGHDLTLKNEGDFGYTVADFSEAMLGDSSQMKKLEVYQVEVSDIATITNAGLLKLKAFTKCQCITYHGTATYSVDLSDLDDRCIALDEENRTITLTIPHAVLEPINIPRDKIEYGDIDKGVFAFGKIETTAEESNEVEAVAVEKMQEKLTQENRAEEADRFAKMSVWEIFQPLVTSVSADCKLEVKFADE